ncbi:porin family protein [Rurimicrobium arvi]|uniref:Outer membrane protein beta-barrel domain-containing protein n=1 Tax=Rurimicrobium arvi TaxID=2049916 RepID=A0ABP8MIC6_9BACT
MKKTLLAIPLVFAMFSGVQAQNYIGACAAYSFSKLKYDGNEDDDYNGRVSFGVTYNHRIHFINIGAELNLENRGAKASYLDNTYGYQTATERLNFSYLALPLKVGIVVGNKFSAIANIGIVPGYLLGAKDKLSYPMSQQTYSQSVTSMVSKFDLSALAEVGVGFKLASKVSIYGTFRFQPGLTNVKIDQSYTDFKHSSLIANIGAQVAL